MSTIQDQIVDNQQVTLLELLDRLLDKGVVVKGEVLLAVADIDLVYLNLGLLLSSVKTVEQAARREDSRVMVLNSWQPLSNAAVLDGPQPVSADDMPASLAPARNLVQRSNEETSARTLPSLIDDGLEHLLTPKASIDPERVEKGLARLVLTLVELVRKLMENQAIRRIDAGQLHAGEIERVGNAFFLLDEKMEELKKIFGLEDEELNLDLGPLGKLL